MSSVVPQKGRSPLDAAKQYCSMRLDYQIRLSFALLKSAATGLKQPKVSNMEGTNSLKSYPKARKFISIDSASPILIFNLASEDFCNCVVYSREPLGLTNKSALLFFSLSFNYHNSGRGWSSSYS